jgi:CRP/FNR family transcriptional regulator, cyclic AMP receptor protein
MQTDSEVSNAYRTLARRLMERTPGFDRCPPSTIDALIESGVLMRLAKGDVLARRGDPNIGLVLPVEGSLVTSLSAPDGRRHLLAFLHPGVFFNFVPIIDDGPMAHDATAHMHSVVLKMPVEVVRRQRALDPTLHIAFEIQLAERSRRVYDMLSERMLLPLGQRLCRQLVSMVGYFGLQRGSEWTIAMELPQADLADLLGARRQSANVELRRLEDAGWIRLRRSHIDVLQLDALRAEAGGDPFASPA